MVSPIKIVVRVSSGEVDLPRKCWQRVVTGGLTWPATRRTAGCRASRFAPARAGLIGFMPGTTAQCLR